MERMECAKGRWTAQEEAEERKRESTLSRRFEPEEKLPSLSEENEGNVEPRSNLQSS